MTKSDLGKAEEVLLANAVPVDLDDNSNVVVEVSVWSRSVIFVF